MATTGWPRADFYGVAASKCFLRWPGNGGLREREGTAHNYEGVHD